MNTKKEIIRILEQNSEYVSGEKISEFLHITRTAVWKNINALRNSGYSIESVTNRGYKLIARPDKITPEEIALGLKTKLLAKRIDCYDRIDSTNEEAKRKALAGAPDGSLFVAEEQTGGKGRLGRSWTSPAGQGLWFTVLLRSSLLPSQAANITLLAGLAVCRAIQRNTGCAAMIKWPNDIVIESKKVCGILTEMAAEMDRIEYMAVGIGVNVNNENFPEELSVKATSLRLESGSFIRRVPLLQEILFELETVLKDFPLHTESLLREYKSRCVSLNRRVGFIRENRKMVGVAEDISPSGELIVRCDDGTKFPISSGEVTVQGIYGE
ncbi:biotin--[acetyl-CoA-carboxylase] ligase [Caproiciproducens galactitolivorans]|uniref:Bifunctional ligase/repressor BirA n=1 Tax=Caproiciproducens galactitolivorans TaxID=642589 RepID=A0A4Z0XX84_9FIRM|nr:biotin--[acetyl-CoA-carboxylase] ligase [Caproiciproducens galactitolivorans]QEY33910.1 biotin--[acetyl-CoA-carboxylase] ligase [Caproiciproducens galactitolivorans]TGJ76129.1 bifunctional ligase/repressor BirA [Caproiciproducens galactitolivorans]